ncbi:MAG: CoA ester lyase [Deltaproteobacteria bacterium]|nr:CoA ester lyase [Deltaproteobacteria bacterium]
MPDSEIRPLRRSLLFVPGGEPRKLDKACQTGADALILDLEDAVAPEAKDRARELIAAALKGGSFGRMEIVLRVNAPGTPWFAADVEAAVTAGARTIMLPKVEGVTVIESVSATLDRLEQRDGAGGNALVAPPLSLIALVESPAGIVCASSLGDASPRLDALCFGHVDFSREMGIETADAAKGIAYHARCTLAIAARASGLTPIDTVFLDVRDEKGFREDAAMGVGLGFEGKLCIHPAQVKIVNELMTPTPEQVSRARRVLAAWETARAEGRGVFALDGRMIDAPVISQHSRILDRARRAGLLEDQGAAEEGRRKDDAR